MDEALAARQRPQAEAAAIATDGGADRDQGIRVECPEGIDLARVELGVLKEIATPKARRTR